MRVRITKVKCQNMDAYCIVKCLQNDQLERSQLSLYYVSIQSIAISRYSEVNNQIDIFFELFHGTNCKMKINCIPLG